MNISSENPESGFNILQGLILITISLILAVVVLAAYSSAKRTARDAERVSDVLQLQKALKYYYEEFGYYPQASNKVAVGVDNAFSRFVSPWPAPPKPADGLCTDQHNVYAYEQLNGGDGYILTFCLGEGYGNLKPGLRSATPTGYQ